jgi:hypothetical protein
MPIVYRLTKGSPLTHAELDGNFQFLTGSINAISGTYATTGSNVFNGNQTLYGNLSVFGTASFTFTTSSITTISASTFGVSIASPTIRFGRYDVLDSGASISTSSFAWDSTNTRWIYVRTTGSVSSSAVFLTGPLGSSGQGNETALSQYRIPVSNGDQSLINSYIYTNGPETTISGALAVTNVISIGNVINSSPQYGKFLIISGSYPGVVLGHSNVGKAYSFGVGDFSQFFINDDNLSVTRFVLESNGWIGLGKSPSTFLDVSGSTNIGGGLNVVNGITGSLLGTSSYATQALNASTASLATTASFALTASFAANIPTTSSYALQALNASTASLATTASYVLNAVSSSFASTASFLRPLSQSVTLTGSLNIRNTTTTSTFTTLGRSGSLYIDFVGLGLNYIDGNALFIRNSAGTTNLVTVSGSRFIVSGSTELSGSLSVQKADGDRILFVSSSVSSSISSSIIGTTASFNGAILFISGGSATTTWNTDLDIYYSGNSGSGHTNLSPVSNQISDSAQYSTFTINLTDIGSGNGITLTPSGSIPDDKYTIWIYASGSINKWFQKTDNDLGILSAEGIVINLNGGSTNEALETDLVTTGFAEVSDPNPYSNNINTILTTTTSFTSSLMNVKADTTITGSFSVSGSTLKVGNNTLTGNNTIVGNNTISGSNIITGSNFLIGSTTLSGSIIISGSTINRITGSTAITGSLTVRGATVFSDTTFTVTGSQFYTGSSNYVGNQTITGSLRLQSNGVGTGLYINGQRQFNYISLYNTASILPTQNVSGSFIFGTQVGATGISVVSGSRITFANTGEYNLQFSAQLYTQTAATVYIWLKRNGVNESDSAGRIGPTQNGDYLIPAWNYVGQFASGSYIELAYQSNQTNTQFQYVTAAGNIPSAPSIILSVVQVS